MSYSLKEKDHAKAESKQLEDLIAQAMKKVGASKENDICRYLPVAKGGYIHHFTMQKMKTEQPKELQTMIQKHIINAGSPSKVTPKQRAPRGSRKRHQQQHLSKQDLDMLLHLARQAGNKEMIRKLTPKKDLRTIKRELIASIKHGQVEEDLWQTYCELINHQHIQPNHFAAPSNPFHPAGANF
jgi:hypothetical protein